MNGKKKLLILILVLLLVIGGAYILYNALGDEVTPEQPLADNVQPNTGEQEKPQPDDSAKEDDSSEEDSGDAGQESQQIPVPDFVVYDKDGNEVHFEDFIGKPIVLNFWASWCGPCRMEMPHFQEAFEDIGDEVHFIMINSTYGRETKEDAAALIETNGYTFPVYYDTNYIAQALFGTNSLPTTFFIDKDGYVRTYALGALDAENLRRGIDIASGT